MLLFARRSDRILLESMPIETALNTYLLSEYEERIASIPNYPFLCLKMIPQ